MRLILTENIIQFLDVHFPLGEKKNPPLFQAHSNDNIALFPKVNGVDSEGREGTGGEMWLFRTKQYNSNL